MHRVDETVIYFSKSGNLIGMLLILMAGSFGFYLLLTTNSWLLGVLTLVVGIALGRSSWKQAANRAPQIFLNAKGMATSSTSFRPWSEIHGEEVVGQFAGKYTHYYLVYEYPGGMEKLSIDDLNTNPRQLMHLLLLYRGRFQKARHR